MGFTEDSARELLVAATLALFLAGLTVLWAAR
jgi:hypothetical protein